MIFQMTGPEIFPLILLGLLTFYFLLTRRLNNNNNLPPGPWRLIPLLGHLPQLGSQPYKTLMKWSEKYGPVFHLYFGSFPTIVINDAKLIREALMINAFSGRPDIKMFKDRSGGICKGIIFADGDKWLEQRRFSLKSLKDFGFGRKSMESVILEEATELADRLKTNVGKPMPINNAFNSAILNSLWTILTGERFNQDDPELTKAIGLLTTNIQENNVIQGVTTFLPWLATWFPRLSGYEKILRDVPAVTGFIWKTIPKHQETFQEGVYRDFLDVYIDKVRKTTDTSSPFHSSNSEMDWVLVDLFVAGTETTSTALSWTFVYLSKWPGVQDKLHKEIDAIIGQSRQPALADRDQMPYAQAIFHEILRHSTFVPFGIFHSTTHETELNDYTIPKDTMVIPNLYAVHHNKEIWGDSENFRPERWLNSKGEFQRNENFMAFSTGKRVCLGENVARDEYFLFLITLFQRYQVSCNDEIDLEPIVGLVLSPKPHNFILKERM